MITHTVFEVVGVYAGGAAGFCATAATCWALCYEALVGYIIVDGGPILAVYSIGDRVTTAILENVGTLTS